MGGHFFVLKYLFMKALQIGDLVARVPIVQGGMGVGISMSGLASVQELIETLKAEYRKAVGASE